MAFLELCGWIETTLDEIYLSIGKTKLEKELIERHIYNCYSFNQKNFKSCLKFCLGEIKYNELKQFYNVSGKTSSLKDFLNKLDKLTDVRNEYAHTSYEVGVLQSGQLGLNDIQKDFLFLLRQLVNLYFDLNKI